MKTTLLVISMLLVASFCLAQVPSPPDFVTFERTSPTTGTIRWSTIPSEFVVYYYLALHPDTHNYNLPVLHEPPWNGGSTPGHTAPLESYLEGPGVYKYDLEALEPTSEYIAYVAAVNGDWGWDGFGTSWIDPTLPVELSSFSAVQTIQNYVQLNWTTQSETNLQGYYVYRSTCTEISNGILISGLIQPTNTSNQQSYTYLDSEIVECGQYYYWLQSMEMNGIGNFHGPVSILVNPDGSEPDSPVILLETGLRAIFPNPFNPSTTIKYQLSSPETVNISIYNIRGQMINSWSKSHSAAGIYSLVFDGQDSKGNIAASGVYYIVMNAGKHTSTQKIVLIK